MYKKLDKESPAEMLGESVPTINSEAGTSATGVPRSSLIRPGLYWLKGNTDTSRRMFNLGSCLCTLHATALLEPASVSLSLRMAVG